MRLLAAAIFAGLALIACAVVYYTHETRGTADPYADAEDVVRTYSNARGFRTVSVRRVSGPFVLVTFSSGNCVLVDVSTQYEGEGGDAFWNAGFSGSDPQSIDC